MAMLQRTATKTKQNDNLLNSVAFGDDETDEVATKMFEKEQVTTLEHPAAVDLLL